MPRKTIRCSDCETEMDAFDKLFSWQNGKTEEWLCEDCFESRVGELTLTEIARLIGSEVRNAEDFMYKEE